MPAVPVVIDAAALVAFEHDADAITASKAVRVQTSHAGGAGRQLACEGRDVLARTVETGRELAKRFAAVCVMKRGTGYVIDGRATGTGRDTLLMNRYGNIGLATSGSGDTLSGTVGGLVARGADAFPACLERVPARGGGRRARQAPQWPLGFLACEPLDEVPMLMSGLGLHAATDAVGDRRCVPTHRRVGRARITTANARSAWMTGCSATGAETRGAVPLPAPPPGRSSRDDGHASLKRMHARWPDCARRPRD